MGQFSTEIYILPGSTLSGNQQYGVICVATKRQRCRLISP